VVHHLFEIQHITQDIYMMVMTYMTVKKYIMKILLKPLTSDQILIKFTYNVGHKAIELVTHVKYVKQWEIVSIQSSRYHEDYQLRLRSHQIPKGQQ